MDDKNLELNNYVLQIAIQREDALKEENKRLRKALIDLIDIKDKEVR